jgi:hypothetical protein
MPLAGFEPGIRATERHHTDALDRAAAGIGTPFFSINSTAFCLILYLRVSYDFRSKYWLFSETELIGCSL